MTAEKMTAEQLATRLEQLVTEARQGGLSLVDIQNELESAIDLLDDDEEEEEDEEENGEEGETEKE